MKSGSWIVLSISLLFATTVAGQIRNPEMLFKEANEAYEAGSFDEAIEGLEGLAAAGYRSKSLFYNLGNAYYRSGNTGRAVLNYERARLLAPNDEDILHNLAFIRQKQADEISPVPDFFLARWWNNLRSLLNVDSWALLSLFFLWGGIGGLVLWLLGRKRSHRKWGFVVGFALVALSVLPFALALSRQTLLNDSGKAVILASEIVLRSAPDPQSQAIQSLHEGLTIELLDSIGEWYKVRLPDGGQGWLPMESMEEV